MNSNVAVPSAKWPFSRPLSSAFKEVIARVGKRNAPTGFEEPLKPCMTNNGRKRRMLHKVAMKAINMRGTQTPVLSRLTGFISMRPTVESGPKKWQESTEKQTWKAAVADFERSKPSSKWQLAFDEKFERSSADVGQFFCRNAL